MDRVGLVNVAGRCRDKSPGASAENIVTACQGFVMAGSGAGPSDAEELVVIDEAGQEVDAREFERGVSLVDCDDTDEGPVATVSEAENSKGEED